MVCWSVGMLLVQGADYRGGGGGPLQQCGYRRSRARVRMCRLPVCVRMGDVLTGSLCYQLSPKLQVVTPPSATCLFSVAIETNNLSLPSPCWHKNVCYYAFARRNAQMWALGMVVSWIVMKCILHFLSAQRDVLCRPVPSCAGRFLLDINKLFPSLFSLCVSALRGQIIRGESGRRRRLQF